MILGIPKEIKDQEGRVALLPEAVANLVRAGHRVLLQSGAGLGCGYSDALYRRAGARIVSTIRLLYAQVEMVVKVKEPLPQEYRLFRPGLRIFCYLHLAANLKLSTALLRGGVTALGFETLEVAGTTPLLKPMSEIAGRLSVTVGAHYLQTNHGGRGVLLAPTDFSSGASVVVVGGGNVGRAAAEVAAAIGAEVKVFETHPERLQDWKEKFPKVQVLPASPREIAVALRRADLVVAAVYIPGASAPKVIRKKMVQAMQPGSVLVDVAVDQGGAAETTRPTSHSRPIYRRYGVIHYAVPNMPALVSRTASEVLSRVLLPYVAQVAAIRRDQELLEHPVLRTSVNVMAGKIVHPGVLASLKAVRTSSGR